MSVALHRGRLHYHRAVEGPGQRIAHTRFFSVLLAATGDTDPVVLVTRLIHRRRDEAPPQRKEFWARWSTRLVVTVCAIAALIGLALITDPGPEAWYTKMGELIEAVISKAHPGPVVGR